MVPTLILNPRGDKAFVAFAESIMTGGVDDPAIFQLRLRDRYPRAIVRLRELANEPFTIWYCYREGHWVGSSDEREE